MSRTLSRVLHAAAVMGLLLQTGCVRGVEPDQPGPRVRSLNPFISDLVREGRERSLTFRRLTDAIEGSDGIVYLEPGRCPVAASRACLLHWIGGAGEFRMLRVYLRLEGDDRDHLIAVVAHELQHVNEVLEHSNVRTSVAVRSLFMHIGSGNDARSGETHKALDVEDLVAEELSRTPH
jgi:hypothetical protein